MTDLHKLVQAAFERRRHDETAGDVLTRLSGETGIEWERLKSAWEDLQPGMAGG